MDIDEIIKQLTESTLNEETKAELLGYAQRYKEGNISEEEARSIVAKVQLALVAQEKVISDEETRLQREYLKTHPQE